MSNRLINCSFGVPKCVKCTSTLIYTCLPSNSLFHGVKVCYRLQAHVTKMTKKNSSVLTVITTAANSLTYSNTTTSQRPFLAIKKLARAGFTNSNSNQIEQIACEINTSTQNIIPIKWIITCYFFSVNDESDRHMK